MKLKPVLAGALVLALVALTGVLSGAASAQVYPPDGVTVDVPVTEAPAEEEAPAAEVVDVVAEVAANDPEVRAAVEALDSLNLATATDAQIKEVLDDLLAALRDALPNLDIEAITPLKVTVNPDGTLSEVVPALILLKDAETGEIAVATVGDGYAPGSSITISVESTPLELGEVDATDKGKFVAIAELPADLPVGKHTLKATGTDAAGKPRILAQPIEVKKDDKAEIAADPASAVSNDEGGSMLPIVFGIGIGIVIAGAGFALGRRRVATS